MFFPCLPIVSQASVSPSFCPVPGKHLEDVLILLPEVLVQVAVQHGVDARVGETQNVADAVDLTFKEISKKNQFTF
jgi:hypothetical protein